MNTLIHADIFFFITTTAVIFLTFILAIIGVYVVLILQDTKAITKKIKEESDELAGDLKELRGEIKKEGANLKKLFNFFIKKAKSKINK